MSDDIEHLFFCLLVICISPFIPSIPLSYHTNWGHGYLSLERQMVPFMVSWITLKYIYISLNIYSVQFSSVPQSCPTLCDPMNYSTPGLPVHHRLPESTQTHVHQVGDAIQSSHPLSSPSLPALNLSQHQGLFKSQLFASGGQSIGVSASTSVLPMNTQDWSLLG